MAHTFAGLRSDPIQEPSVKATQETRRQLRHAHAETPSQSPEHRRATMPAWCVLTKQSDEPLKGARPPLHGAPLQRVKVPSGSFGTGRSGDEGLREWGVPGTSHGSKLGWVARLVA